MNMLFDSWSLRYIENIVEKEEKLLFRSNFSFFLQYFITLLLDFHVHLFGISGHSK